MSLDSRKFIYRIKLDKEDNFDFGGKVPSDILRKSVYCIAGGSLLLIGFCAGFFYGEDKGYQKRIKEEIKELQQTIPERDFPYVDVSPQKPLINI